jgi:hypothetical protein
VCGVCGVVGEDSPCMAVCFRSWCGSASVWRCGEGMTPLMRTLHIDQGIY